MNKKLIAGMSALGTLAVAGVAVGTVALVQQSDTNKKLNILSDKVTTNVSSINDILSQITTSYDSQADAIDIQEGQISDIQSVYETLALNVQNLLQTVQDQGNAFIALYKADIAAELQKVYDALNTQGLDTNTRLETIYTAVSELMSKTTSLEVMQSNLEQKITEVETNADAKIRQLWESFATLETYVNTQSAITDANLGEISFQVGALQNKVQEIDGLSQQLVSINQDVQTTIDRLKDLETKVSSIKDYDDTELRTRITALEALQTDIASRITTIDGALTTITSNFDTMSNKIDAMELNLQLTGQIASANALSIADIKTTIDSIQAVQGSTATEITNLKADFVTLSDQLSQVFAKNVQLEQDVNDLYDKQTSLFNNFIDIQTLLRQLQDELHSTSTVVSIKSNLPIYDANTQRTTYPSIDIPDLVNAKSIALYIKLSNKDGSSSYVAKIIDTYPEDNTTFIGYASTVNKEQFMMGATLGLNKINVTKIWTKANWDSNWSDVNSNKVFNISLVNAIIIY